jgi:GPH family glycoside/pentoside/hexuronide:cation symporter
MQSDWFSGDMVNGASWLAIIIGTFTICVGVLPAIFLKERHSQIKVEPVNSTVEERPANISGFIKGFLATIKFKPFLRLCGATFLVFNGFMMVSSFQTYVIIYYVFAGDQSLGAEYAGWAGTISAIATFFVIFIVTKLSEKIGKRRTFFFSTGLSIVGYGSKWFLYNPDFPSLLLLPPVFIAFGLGGLFTLMGSMMADVCDLDELKTSERREGMFGSIYWWVVKLGMAIALAAGGFLLNATGFDVALGGQQSADTIFYMRLIDAVIPMLTSALAIWIIVKYPLTETKAHEVRIELESRRGKLIAEKGDSVEEAELSYEIN